MPRNSSLRTKIPVFISGLTAIAIIIIVGLAYRESMQNSREMAEARGVQVRIDETLPTLTVDVGRLELTFVNLLSNAIKYSDPAKSTRTVEIVGAELGDTWCRVEIRDNGLGIPTDAIDTIFHRFTRAHAGRTGTADVGGIGLGLSIVDDCVRAMGGRIDLSSTEGQGTTFSLTLPLEASIRATAE